MKRIINILRSIIFHFSFKKFHISSRIIHPLRIDGKEFIQIGEKVTILDYAWLAADSLLGIPNLEIDNGTYIGHFAHIYSTKEIYIGKNVIIANKVYISDNLHKYDDIEIPISKQGVLQKNEVYIGDNSWIGENVCVIGAKIGKHCVIGANSVVTKDIPDYSVAVGCPAKVIKKYDFNSNEWIKV